MEEEKKEDYEINETQNYERKVTHHYENPTKKSHKKTIIISISIIAIIAVISIISAYIMGMPIIDFKGEKEETIEVGTVYNDPGVNVYTKFKNVTDKVIVDSNVDTSKIGIYNITYKVPYFNSHKTYTRIVKVLDTQSPQLNLVGDTEYKLQFGNNYEEPGYTAIDNYDGDITANVEINQINVDENNIEKHYKIFDSSGNTAEVIRHITIVDDVAPKIKLKGDSVVSLIIGATYSEQGATADDNKDGDISNNIKITGEVDTSKEGTYIITYTVNDSNGNTTTEQRKVIVGNQSTNGIIYLTFDDGPSSTITPQILDVLKQKGVNATFFILNYNEANENIVKREISEGHAIGIHGYSHDYSQIYTSVDACYNNIIKLQEKIYNSTGIKTKILRFPGGSSNTVSRKYCNGVMTAISKKVLSEGFKYYDWNVLSGDSGDVKTSEGVYNNVTKGLKHGRNNIVLMHDFSGNTKTLQALPGIIDYGLANGYKFEVITTDTEMITQTIQN